MPDASDFLDVRIPAGIEAHWVARGRRARGEQTLALLRECLRLDTDGRAVSDLPSLGRADLDDDVWETPVYSSSGDDVSAAADDRGEPGPGRHLRLGRGRLRHRQGLPSPPRG